MLRGKPHRPAASTWLQKFALVHACGSPTDELGAGSRADAKSGSGQGGSQNPRLVSDAVAQQSDGHIRAEILLKCAHRDQAAQVVGLVDVRAAAPSYGNELRLVRVQKGQVHER